MRKLIIFLALVLVSPTGNAQPLTERRISSADIGTVVFLAPESWSGVESYDDLEAAAVYELSSRKRNFRLRLSVRQVGTPLAEDEIIPRLDAYLKYAIAEKLADQARYEVRAARFGPGSHGIYARIRDRQAEKGAFPYFSHGARVMGNKFIVFTLESSDDDLSLLNPTLDIMTSFDAKQEWAGAPNSYLCEAEQLVGFDIVDEKWGGVTATRVRQNIVVRRSRPGDAFADTSEWVFLGSDDETASSACNNESIAIGAFLCSSAGDEEFRMDSKTLRFVYAYLGGYHDLPADELPDDEDPKPTLVIGSCTAQ
jgi:hypothetical protein